MIGKKLIRKREIFMFKKAKTKVKPGRDKVVLTISDGKEIKVPDFAARTSEDVVEWVSKNNLRIEFAEKHHVSVKKGGLIGINYEGNY